MSNLIFEGYTFGGDLLAKWFLQNTLSPLLGETAEMQFELLDDKGNGFELASQTVYGGNPNFVFRKDLNGVKTDLLSFDGTASQFKFKNALDMGGKTISSLADPVSPGDAATKSYVLSQIGGYTPPAQSIILTGDVTASGLTGSSINTTLNKRLDQITAPTASVNLNSQKITNLATPTASSDAASKGYVDSKTWTASQISDFNASILAFRLEQFSAPLSDLNMNSHRLLNLLDPISPQHAVTKAFLDAQVFDVATRTSGTVPPSRLTGYPSSSSVFLRGDGVWVSPSGAGDVVGPASSVDNKIPTFSGITGKLLKQSPVSIDATGLISNIAAAVSDTDAASLSVVKAYRYGKRFDFFGYATTASYPYADGVYNPINFNTNFTTTQINNQLGASFYSTSTSTLFTIQESGFYKIDLFYRMYYYPAGGTISIVWMTVNTTTVPTSILNDSDMRCRSNNSYDRSSGMSFIRQLNAGDVLRFYVYTDAGTTMRFANFSLSFEKVA